jgi:magnesium transporter
MVDIDQVSVDSLVELIDSRSIKNLRYLFDELNIVDLAELVEQLNDEQILFLFKTLKKDVSAEIFTYLSADVKEDIIQSFTSGEITSMLDNLYSDDIVDFLEEMPANVVRHVLLAATSEQREDINLLLSYPENSAGSLMSLDFVELEAQDTIAHALKEIKLQGNKAETIQVSFVIDHQRKLVGTISLRKILFAKDTMLIEDLMDIDMIFVETHDDQESVAKVFAKYDMNVIPVVNDEQRLIGILTIDDIIDVVQEEITEDIHKMAAILPLEESYMETSVLDISKSRIPWLLVLMISATFTGNIIAGFEDRLSLIPALAYFIPMIMGAGGNAGSQASSMVIRGIAIDQLGSKDYWKVLSKELGVAFLCGAVLFLANLARLIFFMPSTDLNVDLVVSATLFLTILVAKLVGGMLPLVAKSIKQDPAAMAAPLITTIVDAVALLIYFSLAVSILQIA